MTDLIPPNHIALISHNKQWQKQEYIDQIFTSLKNDVKRDWFVKHAYFCTPLVMGNQHGFAVKSLYNFSVRWNGGDASNDVEVKIHKNNLKYYNLNSSLQSVRPHFGMGTFTIQTCFTMRTPDGVNLMTINPPNYFIDGLYCMTGVVETDNLRRDFTFNTRITRKNKWIKINKGDIIGCVIPYPRHFIDLYKFSNAPDVLSEDQIVKERIAGFDHGRARSQVDKYKRAGNGRLYFDGKDVYGNKFKDHQTKLDS